MNTSSANNKGNPILGGSHLKRVPITIQYKNKPEMKVPGYALSHEILPDHLSFFAAQKFPVDEELVVYFSENGEEKNMNVILRNMHEQISSGRVMTAVPSEEDPFPARKFYRCYTTVLNAVENAGSETEAEPQMETAPEAAAEPVADPAAEIPVAEVPDEEQKAA